MRPPGRWRHQPCAWEERFECTYGYWRGSIDDLVLAFQTCGDFEGGFARVYCGECRAEYLLGSEHLL